MQERQARFDNIKGLLILLVVFGHCLELFSGSAASSLYRLIYLFHMPAFLFVSGCFARFSWKRLGLQLLLPYLLLQPLYILVTALTSEQVFVLQYTSPHWILWYLYALIAYTLLVPLLNVSSRPLQVGLLIALAAASLAAGFCSSIGYEWSASRIITFAPFFFAGLWFRKDGGSELLQRKPIRLGVGLGAVALFLLCAGYVLVTQPNSRVLHGALGYEALGYSWKLKALVMAGGFAGTVSLLLLPDRKLPVLSMLGANTLPVFCLHGLVIRWLRYVEFFRFSQSVNLLLALAVSAALVLILGNPFVSRGFRFIFCGGLPEQVWKAIHR